MVDLLHACKMAYRKHVLDDDSPEDSEAWNPGRDGKAQFAVKYSRAIRQSADRSLFYPLLASGLKYLSAAPLYPGGGRIPDQWYIPGGPPG